MLFSTAHWFPLVNGYSDYIPADFREAAVVLDSFPSTDSFRRAEASPCPLRRAFIGTCSARARSEIGNASHPFAHHLRPLAADLEMTLYRVVGYP